VCFAANDSRFVHFTLFLLNPSTSPSYLDMTQEKLFGGGVKVYCGMLECSCLLPRGNLVR
jgi:hypothetical protein